MASQNTPADQHQVVETRPGRDGEKYISSTLDPHGASLLPAPERDAGGNPWRITDGGLHVGGAGRPGLLPGPEPDVRGDRQARETAPLPAARSRSGVAREAHARHRCRPAAAGADHSESARAKPASSRSSVVFPLPDDPRIAVNERAGTCRSTPVSTACAPNPLHRPLTASSLNAITSRPPLPGRRTCHRQGQPPSTGS